MHIGISANPGSQAETDLSHFFELSRDVMCVAGADGYFKRVNKSFEKLLGYTAEELLSRPFISFIHPDDQTSTLSEVAGLNATSRGSICFENRYFCKDGSVRWLAWQSSATPENGLIYANARDITASKKQVSNLRLHEVEAEASIDAICGALPQIVWTSTPDGNLDYYNQQWFDYTGLSLEQTQEWGWAPVIHPDDLKNCIDHWTQAVATGELYEVEYRFKRASDGSYRWHLGRARPSRDSEGKITKWFGTWTDIEDQRQALEISKMAERRFRTIVEQSPFATQVVDIDGKVLKVNSAWQELWDVPDTVVSDYILRDYNALTDPLLRSLGISELVEKAFKGQAQTAKSIYYDPASVGLIGRPRWVDTFYNPIKDCAGQVTEVILLFNDITESRTAAQAVKEHQEMLQGILDHTPDLIFVKDTEGRILLANQQYERIFSLTQKQIIGKTDHDLFPEEVADKFVDNDRTVMQSGRAVRQEEVAPHADGLHTYISVKFPIRNDKNEIIAVGGIASDITEQKRHEAERSLLQVKTEAAASVQESEARLRAVFDSAFDAIISYDAEGTLTDWNPRAEEVFGWKMEEVLGKKVTDLIIQKKDHPVHFEMIQQFLSTGEGYFINHSAETEAVRKSGAVFPVQLSISPVQTKSGYLFTAFLSDITERKRTTDALILARDLADKATLAKSEFLANMSHEVRTPINGVIGMTGLLLDTKLDPEQRDYTETIRSSADSLLTVINDILDFSKIEAGKLDIEKVSFNLDELIQNIERNLSFGAKKKGLKLLKSAPSENACTHFNGDPTRIGQILTNLVNNAIKFTSRGHVIIEVFQEPLDSDQIRLRFEISDTGIGIPDESLSRMFKPFSQADGSTSRRYGGTGLGLSISKQLTEIMGGEIGVRSKTNEGSTFWFTLTLKKSAESVASSVDVRVDPTVAPTARPIRILLAEDNMVNQKIAIRMLEKFGFRVDAVANGLEAIDALRVAPYDLILMDCQMPELDGYQATGMIRSSRTLEFNTIPIIAMTANAMAGDRERCLEAGMTDYVSKPIKAANLVAIIQKTLLSHVKAQTIQ